jgi:hypothetical protein
MHELVIKADARAMSAVTALDTRVSQRWQASKADDRIFGGKPFSGTSECISYMPDGTVSIFRSTRTRKPNRVTATVAAHRITAADLAPIGDQNH